MNACADIVILARHPQLPVAVAGCQQEGMTAVFIPGGSADGMQRIRGTQRNGLRRLQNLTAKLHRCSRRRRAKVPLAIPSGNPGMLSYLRVRAACPPTAPFSISKVSTTSRVA